MSLESFSTLVSSALGVNFGFIDVGDDSAGGQHHGSHGGGNDHGGKCEDDASKDRAAQSFHRIGKGGGAVTQVAPDTLAKIPQVAVSRQMGAANT